MEKKGIAYCSSDFSKLRPSKRTVFAKAVFAHGNTAQEQLPLTRLYDHIDFIDVISAQEFGLDGIVEGKFLLCILVAQTVSALNEMEELILGVSHKVGVSTIADSEGGVLRVGGKTAPVSDEVAPSLQNASPAEVLAALTHWCVGYAVQFFMPEDRVL